MIYICQPPKRQGRPLVTGRLDVTKTLNLPCMNYSPPGWIEDSEAKIDNGECHFLCSSKKIEDPLVGLIT